MPTILTPKDREDWLAMRAEDVTSTEVSALFADPVTGASLSPYMTDYELYHIKAGLTEDTFEENERMKWGKRLEASIAAGIAEDLGVKIEPYNHYVRHDKEPRFGASFDFRIIDHPKGLGNLEIKNVDGLVYRNKWSETEATDYIELQVQAQMEIADIEWTLICALVGGNEPKFIYRDRDREVGAALCDAVRDFWILVDAGIPLAPNYARDSDFIVSLHQSAGVNLLETEDEEMMDRLKSHYNIGQEIKALETERKEVKARIIDEVGDEYNKVKAGRYTLSCGMTKETPATEITEEMVGESYGGRKSYRTFRVTEKKGE